MRFIYPLFLTITLLNAGTFSIGPKISTLGFGLEASKYMNNYLSIRGSMQYFFYNHAFNTSYTFKKNMMFLSGNKVNITIPTRFRLFSIGVVADIRPFQNSFSIGAGLFYNNNGATCKLYTADNPIFLNGIPNPRSNFGTVNGEASFNKISPYLGIRYDSDHKQESTWNFFAEIGCLFQGNLKVNKMLPPQGVIFGEPLFAPVADDLIQKSYKNKVIRWLKFYPVIGFGLQYKV